MHAIARRKSVCRIAGIRDPLTGHKRIGAVRDIAMRFIKRHRSGTDVIGGSGKAGLRLWPSIHTQSFLLSGHFRCVGPTVADLIVETLSMSEDTLGRIIRLEELAAWHRINADRAGADWVYEARLRTAEDLERRAAKLRAELSLAVQVDAGMVGWQARGAII